MNAKPKPREVFPVDTDEPVVLTPEDLILEPWDPVEFLRDDSDLSPYLDETARYCDPAMFARALSDAARAKGMTKVAKAAGLGRESLYKALSADAHPRHETIVAVLRALGLRFAVVPITDEDRELQKKTPIEDLDNKDLDKKDLDKP